MTKYWLFALVAHPGHAAKLFWINRRQRPPVCKAIAIGRLLFQMDFGNHFG